MVVVFSHVVVDYVCLTCAFIHEYVVVIPNEPLQAGLTKLTLRAKKNVRTIAVKDTDIVL